MIPYQNIGFLGGGKIAQAFIKGMQRSGLIEGRSLAASIHPNDIESRKNLQALGNVALEDNISVVSRSEVVFVAVKPDMVASILKEVKPASSQKLFLSLAMGIKISELTKHLQESCRIIRIMTNISISVCAGCSVYAKGSNTNSKDVECTKAILQSVGGCEEITETLLDVATALVGSGPAFTFVFIESLADAAVKMGMPRDIAYRLGAQTVFGAGQLVHHSNLHPAILKDDVASPGGSTAAGLSYLEKKCFRSAVAGAIEQATLQCKKISG